MCLFIHSVSHFSVCTCVSESAIVCSVLSCHHMGPRDQIRATKHLFPAEPSCPPLTKFFKPKFSQLENGNDIDTSFKISVPWSGSPALNSVQLLHLKQKELCFCCEHYCYEPWWSRRSITDTCPIHLQAHPVFSHLVTWASSSPPFLVKLNLKLSTSHLGHLWFWWTRYSPLPQLRILSGTLSRPGSKSACWCTHHRWG